MNVAADVTKEMLIGVIEKTLSDLENEEKIAREAYNADKTNDFQRSMITAFQCAADMIRTRMETLED